MRMTKGSEQFPQTGIHRMSPSLCRRKRHRRQCVLVADPESRHFSMNTMYLIYIINFYIINIIIQMVTLASETSAYRVLIKKSLLTPPCS